LIKYVTKYAALSWREQGLFIKVFFLTGVVRIAILLLPFRWLALILGRHMGESPMKEDIVKLQAAIRIGWLVDKVSRYTPWESKCLVQAIVGKIILRQHGIANTLFLGVRRDEGKNLVAHAWLRCGEMIITGGKGQEWFTVVGKFAD